MADNKFRQYYEEMKTRGAMVVVFDSQPEKPLLCKPVDIDDFTMTVDVDREDISPEVVKLLGIINAKTTTQTQRVVVFKHSIRMVA